jgi:hypothetical protein
MLSVSLEFVPSILSSVVCVVHAILLCVLEFLFLCCDVLYAFRIKRFGSPLFSVVSWSDLVLFMLFVFV